MRELCTGGKGEEMEGMNEWRKMWEVRKREWRDRLR
jgi:hypothetical protein